MPTSGAIHRGFVERLRFFDPFTLLVLPMALYVAGFTFYPLAEAVVMGFVDRFTHEFTLSNYYAVIQHYQFRESLRNTLIVTGAGLFLELSLGLVIALILAERFPGSGGIRALLLLPLGIPTVVSATNMRYIFDTSGFLNSALVRLGLLEHPVDFAGGVALPLMTILVADLWKVTPLIMLILLAGLEAIPKELYRAASMDGAGPWQRFRHVTLPLLKPSITMALIIRGIDAFRIFELPLILTGRHTPLLATYTYFEYYDHNNVHTSAASGTILLVIIFVFITFYLRFVGRKET
ncbi:MAG: sugar ABC transporter permease [Deltaproteobacteria bacterium]|nr:sugar ABC transporter permease [Deltaproteobacteria bacterium]